MTKQTTITKALEYLTTHTIKETATRYGVSSATIVNWKRRFTNTTPTKTTDRKTEIIRQIAYLKIELGELTYNELTRAA